MFNERRTEPSLDELFGDIAMRLLMRCDCVTESDIRALLCKLKDARAMALSQAERGAGADIIAAHTSDRKVMGASSRTAGLPKAGKIPLRFI
jgi:hypothetical protein